MRKLYWLGIILLYFTACSSDKADIEINFNANPATDSVKYWEIYLEHRSINYGFTIKDGMEYNDKLKPFYLGKVYNNGYSLIKYPTSVKKEYIIVGIIANNGIRSQLAASKISKINGSGSDTIWVKSIN